MCIIALYLYIDTVSLSQNLSGLTKDEHVKPEVGRGGLHEQTGDLNNLGVWLKSGHYRLDTQQFCQELISNRSCSVRIYSMLSNMIVSVYKLQLMLKLLIKLISIR